MIGPEMASPVSTANGIAGSNPHDRVSGTIARTTATPAAAMKPRVACHSATPAAMSVGRSGVAAIEWYPLLHRNPSSTGHIASWLTTIIAVEAISAGARKAR